MFEAYPRAWVQGVTTMSKRTAVIGNNGATQAQAPADDRTLAKEGLEVLQRALEPAAANGPATEAQSVVGPTASALDLTTDEVAQLHSSRDFIQLLREKKVQVEKIKEAIKYEKELELLQIELVKLQRWMSEKGRRLAIIFEGRDAAGKGGTIRRFIEHLNPRQMRVVALPKPTEEESGQWYFQRYMKQLPNEGEIVFFDRSWYNRGIVEPVYGFCTQQEYERFMQQVPEFEHMLVEDGVTIVKFWFSISKEVQVARFESRRAQSAQAMEASARWTARPRSCGIRTRNTRNSSSAARTPASARGSSSRPTTRQGPAGEHPLRPLADRIRRQGPLAGVAVSPTRISSPASIAGR